jgi:uncharacterized lipoprotein NlpE involved in copper resistance
MKKMTMALLAIALSVPAMAFAQNSTQEDKNTQQQQNQAAEQSQMGSSTLPAKTMSGTVSQDGKSFTSGDKTYMVNNPKSLKAYDNQMVSVKFQYNTDSNTIHILKILPGQ